MTLPSTVASDLRERGLAGRSTVGPWQGWGRRLDSGGGSTQALTSGNAGQFRAWGRLSACVLVVLVRRLLGGGYAAVIVGLGRLLGRDSSLAVAAATLSAAAVFQPVRRRIPQAVDRRFNRRRHDAAQTITAFSARLHQQVDLDTLSAELLAVVNQAMQPTQVSLWLRPSGSGSPDQGITGAS
jgi:hypothetical protein